MDQDCNKLIDPFSSDNLWQLSSFTIQSLQSLDPLQLDEGLFDFTGGFFPNPLELFEKNDSTLQQLNVFGSDNFESYQSTDAITDASGENQDESVYHSEDDTQELEDIWCLDYLNQTLSNKPATRSWENYHNSSFREHISPYFSESGPKGFDAALAHQANARRAGNPGRVAPNAVFFPALFQLGLGWNSMFFRYNHERCRFEKHPMDVRISGISLHALDNMIDGIQQCGMNMLRVRAFVRSIAAKTIELPALSTLASAAAVIIYTLESHLSKKFADIKHCVSLLQIKVLFQRCGELAGTLANMLEGAEKAVSDAQAISIILSKITYFSQRYIWLEKVFNELVVRVMRPWFGFVEAWIGLRSEEPVFSDLLKDGGNFVKLDHVEEPWKFGPRPARTEYSYRPDRIPSLIPAEQAQLIFETGRSLRLLKRSHPHHPIANEGMLRSAMAPTLHCAIAWSDIERIQNMAHEYEIKLRTEILRYNRGEVSTTTVTDSDAFPKPSYEANSENVLAETFEMFDIDDKHSTTLPTNCSSAEDDRLRRLLDEPSGKYAGYEGNFGPELACALSISLSPVITSQALLIDFSCLHLLFKEHDVRHHLTSQWRFQLLGDGFFTCRLSNALFDPEMESAERKSGVARRDVHTGLRLGNRDTWPPASSEIRLVLTNLLDECNFMDGDVSGTKVISREDKELPGGLSFAIRNLSDEELVKCKNPNAIEALDFLRLQYKPPVVLEAIFTTRSLNQYDILFKHLLRLLRMISVVRGLIRDSTARDSLSGDTRNFFHRFRIEAQHFVLTLSEYCFNVGIGTTWQRFQDTLSRIENSVDQGDIDGTIEAAHSVPRLRQFHEEILGQMLFALFLDKRHAQVTKLLESIFGTILAFAPFSRLDGMSGVRHGKNEEAATRLYASFRKRVAAFVRYLRQLDGGKLSSKRTLGRSAGAAFASRSRAEPTSVFEHLLLRLDMKQYY